MDLPSGESRPVATPGYAGCWRVDHAGVYKATAAKLPSGAVQSRSWIGLGRLEPRLGPEALRPSLGRWMSDVPVVLSRRRGAWCRQQHRKLRRREERKPRARPGEVEDALHMREDPEMLSTLSPVARRQLSAT